MDPKRYAEMMESGDFYAVSEELDRQKHVPHEFEGVLEGTPDRPCTKCGKADRHPIHRGPRDPGRTPFIDLRLTYLDDIAKSLRDMRDEFDKIGDRDRAAYAAKFAERYERAIQLKITWSLAATGQPGKWRYLEQEPVNG